MQCQWAEKFGVHMYYVVCNEKNHYVGGTKSGREFLVVIRILLPLF